MTEASTSNYDRRWVPTNLAAQCSMCGAIYYGVSDQSFQCRCGCWCWCGPWWERG